MPENTAGGNAPYFILQGQCYPDFKARQRYHKTGFKIPILCDYSIKILNRMLADQILQNI